MAQIAKEVIQVNLEDEMKKSYLDYAMSVIVGRALPDVRDGLKPVHRRVLFAMKVLGNDWNKAYKKSARVVGDVIGKYHPHGDTAVYDTIVRMAQPFSLRYMLVDGQGNFGSVDGDAPAAMRYTEVRMSRIAHEMLADLDKETVDFLPNYDETEYEPSVMPTRIPGLLVNGSSGIAVGMATNIPPHNLAEVVAATILLMENPQATLAEIMACIPGPDFPTAATINGSDGILQAYETGRGRIYVRSKYHIEENDSGKQSIVVTELPYQVNKARLLEKIAQLVREKKLDGITALRDESDKDGMRMVVELRRGEVAEVIVNNLYKQTAMQSVFGINMVALENGQPKIMNLRQILMAFIGHRREVVIRRTIFDLNKARARAHILEGQTVALANIDEVIALIKASPSPTHAKEALCGRSWKPGAVEALLGRAGADGSKPEDLEDNVGLVDGEYRFSERQAQAILELRLNRLTGLEQERLNKDYIELLELIVDLLDILSSPDRLMAVIKGELEEVSERYGDERRTVIQDRFVDLSLEDLITEEDVVVTLSHAGYAKSQPLEVYRAQRRGGKGRSATNIKDEDFMDHLWVVNTHDTLLCFTSVGKVYWIKVYQLPSAGPVARGKPIVNLLPLEAGEQVNAVVPVREFPDDLYLFFCTQRGIVKRTPLSAFSRPRANGIWAVDLLEGDRLIDVAVTKGSQTVMLFASGGKSIHFQESDVRSMGRTARGVRGIRLREDEKVVSMIVDEAGEILTVTENGYGKRTDLGQYRIQSRGGSGIISIRTSDRNGSVVGAVQCLEDDELMLISDGGTLVRTPVTDISTLSRNTQGVTLIRLAKKEKLVGIARIGNLIDAETDADAEADTDADADEGADDSSSNTVEDGTTSTEAEPTDD